MKHFWLVSRWLWDGKGNAILGSVAAVSKAVWMSGCARGFHRHSLMYAAHLLSHWSFLLLPHNYDQPSIHWQHCNRMPHNTFIVGLVLRRPPPLCFMPILNSQGQLGHCKSTLRLRPLALLQSACRYQTDLWWRVYFSVFNVSFNIRWEWDIAQY